MKNEIVLFKSQDGAVSLPVSVEADTVWLTQAQMAQLFGRSQPVIARHIKNAFDEGEVNRDEAYAKIAYLAENAAGAAKVAIYNLDVIISVGYRVKSQRGVEFRRWATRVLKEYIMRGYAVNRQRIAQLGQAVEVMKRVSNSLDAEQVLDVVKTYSSALDLLDGYDHQTIGKPKAKGRSVVLSYEECRRFIDAMKFSAGSALFGNEKDGSFKSALGAVYSVVRREGPLFLRAGEGREPPLPRHEEPRLLGRQQAHRRRAFPLLPQAQPPAAAQGRLQAHRGPYARRPHRHDRRIQASRKGNDGQPRHDVPGVMPRAVRDEVKVGVR